MGLYDQPRVLQHLDALQSVERGDTPFPIHVRLELTESCNFSCGFCYTQDPKRAGQLQSMGADILKRRKFDFDRVMALIDEFADLGVRAISFTGSGEPLIYPHMAEVLRRVRTRGMLAAVTSNMAMKISDDLMSELAHVKWLRWSMNGGTAEVYGSTNRPRAGLASHAFEQVQLNVGRLIEQRRKSGKGPRVNASYIVWPLNEGDVLNGARLAHRLGIDGISFRPDTPVERISEALSFSPETAKAIHQAQDELNGPDFQVYLEEDRLEDVVKLNDPDLTCFYVNHSTYVAANGDIYPCCYTRLEGKYAIGNILNQTFRDFWMSAERKRKYAALKYDMCPACPYGKTNQLLRDLYAGAKSSAELHVRTPDPNHFV